MTLPSPLKLIILSILTLTLFYYSLVVGPLDFSWNEVMNGESLLFWEFRWPKTLVAMLAGGALALSGLLMQTFFQNPLADPYVLGVQSGASLGVAFWTLLFTSLTQVESVWIRSLGVTGASIIGSLCVLMILLLVSSRLASKLMLLILGLLFAQITGGIINILISLGNAQDLRTFMLWSLGSFQRASGEDLAPLSIIIGLCLCWAFVLAKPLNLLLLGSEEAHSLGVKLKKINFSILTLVSVLSGTVTAFCGPIAFIGIITPHLTRKLLGSSNHFILIPGVTLMGAIIGLGCQIVMSFDADFVLPLNAILGVMGVPFMVVFLWRGRHREVSL